MVQTTGLRHQPGWKNLGFLEEKFLGFLMVLYFSVQIRPNTKFSPKKNILFSQSDFFSVKYNKTHKSLLKYEV